MQNQKLSQQIEQFKPQQINQNTTSQTSVFPSPTPNDNRQLLLPNENGVYFSFEKYGQGCNGSAAGKINTDSADETFVYKNSDFSVSLPNNKKWLSDIYKLNPYDTFDGGISYGGLTVVEGCGMGRTNRLSIVPQRSQVLTVSELNKEKGDGSLWVSGPTTKEIGGKSVVEWEATGLCNNAQAEVIGKKNNYVFSGNCLGDLSDVERTIETMSIY